MVAFNKVNTFVLELGTEGHQLATDAFKVALTNTAPTAASTVWSVGAFPAPAAAGGYTAGGNTLTGVATRRHRARQNGRLRHCIYGECHHHGAVPVRDPLQRHPCQ